MADLTPIQWAGKPISTPGFYADVPMSAYHGANLCDGPSVSSSGLRKIFGGSPMQFWIECPLNPDRLPAPDSDAFVLGRAAHHLLLGERDFAKHFAIRPEQWADWRTNAAKEWRAAKVLEGITVLDGKQVEQVRGMAGLLPWQKGLVDSGLINTAIVTDNDLLKGLIEHTLVFRDEETDVWLKSRPDVIPTSSGVFVDLKTTTSVDFDSIVRTLNDCRYDMQAALIGRACKAVLGIEMTAFLLIFVAKTAPFEVAVVELTHDDLVEAEKDLQVAIRVFARGIKEGRWPGAGGTQSDARPVGRSDWARKRAENRRLFLEQELAA